MRRTRSQRGARAAWAALGLVLGLAGWTVPARAQFPQPKISDINERSGLVSRFIPIEPSLPPDPHRDAFYDTRYGDAPNFRKHPNWIKNGGLYGLRWSGRCTTAYYPYFYGSPSDSNAPDCKPWHKSVRYLQGFVKPFTPVGYYYDQGCRVPLIDLDPIVPGPGPYPFPWFWRGPTGG
ncbi:MAG: hypothetical protein P4L84_20365 [Isosphaeraceae bacterium]|nr:hypothetical protein [Isosphaeraceae bacterium]